MTSSCHHTQHTAQSELSCRHQVQAKWANYSTMIGTDKAAKYVKRIFDSIDSIKTGLHRFIIRRASELSSLRLILFLKIQGFNLIKSIAFLQHFLSSLVNLPQIAGSIQFHPDTIMDQTSFPCRAVRIENSCRRNKPPLLIKLTPLWKNF